MKLVGILVLLISGIYFSIKLKFINLNIKNMIKSIKSDNNSGISSFQTLCISLGARIGVGSLSGVIISITEGGIGSIFWMWISSIICSSNSFIESVISMKYRKKYNKQYEGGPFYYIDYGLNNKFLANIYAIIFLLSYILGFIPIQSNAISKVMTETINIHPLFVGFILVIITAILIYKNTNKLIKTISFFVPFMTIIFLTCGIVVIVSNFTNVISIVGLIIKEAFNKKSFIVGFTVGVLKSIFSNEAGIGTSTIATCATTSNNYMEQGFIQSFGVLFDTLISTLTALIVLTSPYKLLNINNINGIEITKYAFKYHLGNFGTFVLILSLILFALSTIISCYYYIEVAYKYITNSNNINLLRVIILLIVLVSTIISPSYIWNIIDIFVIILSIINTYALFKLRNNIFDMIDNYDKIVNG